MNLGAKLRQYEKTALKKWFFVNIIFLSLIKRY